MKKTKFKSDSFESEILKINDKVLQQNLMQRLHRLLVKINDGGKLSALDRANLSILHLEIRNAQ